MSFESKRGVSAESKKDDVILQSFLTITAKQPGQDECGCGNCSKNNGSGRCSGPCPTPVQNNLAKPVVDARFASRGYASRVK